MLVDPLTSIPAGLLTMVTRGGSMISEEGRHLHDDYVAKKSDNWWIKIVCEVHSTCM